MDTTGWEENDGGREEQREIVYEDGTMEGFHEVVYQRVAEGRMAAIIP
jgi:hypothetical protein